MIKTNLLQSFCKTILLTGLVSIYCPPKRNSLEVDTQELMLENAPIKKVNSPIEDNPMGSSYLGEQENDLSQTAQQNSNSSKNLPTHNEMQSISSDCVCVIQSGQHCGYGNSHILSAFQLNNTKESRPNFECRYKFQPGKAINHTLSKKSSNIYTSTTEGIENNQTCLESVQSISSETAQQDNNPLSVNSDISQVNSQNDYTAAQSFYTPVNYKSVRVKTENNDGKNTVIENHPLITNNMIANVNTDLSLQVTSIDEISSYTPGTAVKKRQESIDDDNQSEEIEIASSVEEKIVSRLKMFPKIMPGQLHNQIMICLSGCSTSIRDLLKLHNSTGLEYSVKAGLEACIKEIIIKKYKDILIAYTKQNVHYKHYDNTELALRILSNDIFIKIAGTGQCASKGLEIINSELDKMITEYELNALVNKSLF